MRARVYRNIDGGASFLGLAFPSEVLVILAVFWMTALTLPPATGLLLTLVAYAALRIGTSGRAPMFLQHSAMFHARRLLHGGRFGPAVRTNTHRAFPYAPRRFRDVPRRQP